MHPITEVHISTIEVNSLYLQRTNLACPLHRRRLTPLPSDMTTSKSSPAKTITFKKSDKKSWTNYVKHKSRDMKEKGETVPESYGSKRGCAFGPLCDLSQLLTGHQQRRLLNAEYDIRV